MKRVVEDVVRTLVGLVFIISGLTKAYDTYYFELIINSYGFESLYYFAPLIIFAELILGLMLIFNIYLKYTSAISIGLIVVFTIIYSYGLIFINIKECGCFGNISIIDSSPYVVYIRNLGLFILLLYLYFHADKSRNNLSFIIIIASVCLLYAGGFISGKSFKKIRNKNSNIESFEPIPLDSHPLSELISVSSDSTYLVSLLSYSCQHCLNSIGNLEQYKEHNIVDNVICAFIEDSIGSHDFFQFFNPSFTIKEFPKSKVSHITEQLPMAYFIKHDTIIGSISGEIPSAYFIRVQNN